MKKTIITIAMLAILSSLVFVSDGTESRTKAYYSGDAINYQGKVIVGTTNMKGMELFRLDDNKLTQKSKTRSFRARYGGFDDFNGLVFNIEGGRLYVYAIDGTYLYKFDASDPSNPKLVNQVTDNSWDWFGGVTKTKDKIVTIGTKGVKMWNYDLMVIDSFKIKTKNHAMQFTANGQYIVYGEENKLKIFDTATRTYLDDIAITSNEDHARYIFNDQFLYFADDDRVMKTGLDGSVYKRFDHISDLGYDIAGLPESPYVYLSDGIGVVKLTKEQLKPVTWAYTTDLGRPNGWAMGLRIVPAGSGEIVILFNNSSIVALNSSLKHLGHFAATEEDHGAVGKLFLAVDKNRAAANSLISLRGGGFAPNKELEIMFGKDRTTAMSGSDGLFTKILTVPDLKNTGVDIKVTGKVSRLTYSISFIIE